MPSCVCAFVVRLYDTLRRLREPVRNMSGTGGTLRPGGRVSERRSAYRKTLDVDEGRRKRGDQVLALRKEKKDDNLQKKRREAVPGLGLGGGFGAPVDGRGMPIRVRPTR